MLSDKNSLPEIEKISSSLASDEDIFNEIDEAIEDRELSTFYDKLSTNLRLINLCFNDGSTLLHTAACLKADDNEKCQNIIRTLLLNGANINAQDIKGRAPIDYAILNANYETVELLIELGAFISRQTLHILGIRDDKGRTVIDYAIKTHYFHMVELLVKKSVPLSTNTIERAKQKDKNGFSAIDYAIYSKHFKTAIFLIQQGAIINGELGTHVKDIKNKKNLNLLNYAIKHSHWNAANILEKTGLFAAPTQEPSSSPTTIPMPFPPSWRR